MLLFPDSDRGKLTQSDIFFEHRQREALCQAVPIAIGIIEALAK